MPIFYYKLWLCWKILEVRGKNNFFFMRRRTIWICLNNWQSLENIYNYSIRIAIIIFGKKKLEWSAQRCRFRTELTFFYLVLHFGAPLGCVRGGKLILLIHRIVHLKVLCKSYNFAVTFSQIHRRYFKTQKGNFLPCILHEKFRVHRGIY